MPSAEEGWVCETVSVDSLGDHTIQFATTSSNPTRSDLIIDRIVLSYPPIIQSQLANQTLFTGETISLNVDAISTMPTPSNFRILRYHWLFLVYTKNGHNCYSRKARLDRSHIRSRIPMATPNRTSSNSSWEQTPSSLMDQSPYTLSI